MRCCWGRQYLDRDGNERPTYPKCLRTRLMIHSIIRTVTAIYTPIDFIYLPSDYTFFVWLFYICIFIKPFVVPVLFPSCFPFESTKYGLFVIVCGYPCKICDCVCACGGHWCVHRVCGLLDATIGETFCRRVQCRSRSRWCGRLS